MCVYENLHTLGVADAYEKNALSLSLSHREAGLTLKF